MYLLVDSSILLSSYSCMGSNFKAHNLKLNYVGANEICDYLNFLSTVPTVVWQNSDGSILSNNRLASGGPVISSTGVGNVSSVSVELMVIGAMRVDTGVYTCSANNNVSGTTRNINITVQCKYSSISTE